MDRRQLDFCFALGWRIMEFAGPLVPEAERREFLAECMEIARQEVDIYERRKRQESNTVPDCQRGDQSC